VDDQNISKKAANTVMDVIAAKSSDPGECVTRVIDLCMRSGYEKAPAAEAPPATTSAGATNPAGNASAEGEASP